MKAVKFENKHLDMIVPRASQEQNFDVFKAAFQANTNHESFTLMDGDTVIACGGVVTLWPNVGEAWIIGSDLVEKKRIAFHKAVVRGLRNIIQSGKYHRIQAIVRADFPQALGWIRLLGFKIEGMMKKYAPDGVDCFMYGLEV